MTIEDDARALIGLKLAAEAAATEYSHARDSMYNRLANHTEPEIAIDGYRIARRPDRTAVYLSQDLLWEQLRGLGLTDHQIAQIVAAAKEEREVFGGIRIERT